MRESVVVAKDRKQEFSPTRSDNDSIHRVRDEHGWQLGPLNGVVGNIRHDGSTPSADSIATQLSSMPTGERAPVLLTLQQTHGNQYVQRVVAGIQAKLVVGHPGDIYEQEADRVADAVMRMPERQVQRQIEPEEEEEELIQTKPLVNQITPFVQRQVEEEEEILQTKKREGTTPEVTHDLESSINALKGGGQPLAESTRNFFEPRFGYNFSDVRVHTDAKAGESAKAVNALAFTMGRDIVFGRGGYALETSGGLRLLAHELTHVVQQGASGIQQPEGGADRGHRPAMIQRKPLTAEERAADLASNRFRDDPRLQAAFDNAPPMRFGERGEAVWKIQHALVDLGFEMPVSTKQGTQEPDSIFGPETFRTIKAFQHMQGITKDGIVGRQTLGELEGRITGRCAPGTLPPLTAPPGGSISVTTVDRSPQRFEACAGGYGHFHWEVAWLTNARNGYIIQEIESAQESRFCDGTPDSGVSPAASHYWEVWRVQQDGKVHPPPGTDTWQVLVHPIRRGTWRLTGKVFFVEQLDPPADFRTGNMDAPLSGTLYATAVQSRNLGPVLLTRHAAGRWECCGDRNVHEPLEGSGEPPSGMPTEADVGGVLSDLLSEILPSGEGLGGTPAVTGPGETCPPGYTQCDFIDDKIATDAQYALYYLYRQGDMARHNALSMLGAVKSRLLQGIYKVDMQKPALMARRHGTNWWNLIPKSAGATVFEGSYKADKQKPALSVFEPEQPPMMVFRGRIASDRAAMGAALSGAWEAATVSQMAVIIPPPSLQPCPIYLPPITIYGEKTKPEKTPCPPGMVPDPNGVSCRLPGTTKMECTDDGMAAAFQKQQDFCASLRTFVDLVCTGPGICDFVGPVSKLACETWEKIYGKPVPATKPPECSEPRAKFYERCVVSTIVGERYNMSCVPCDWRSSDLECGAEILDKHRRWPGRVK